MRLTKIKSIETRPTIAIFEFLKTSKKLSVLLNKYIKLVNTNFTKSTIQPPCAFFCKSSKIVKAFYKICAVPNVSCSRKRGKLSNSCFFPKSLIDNQATDCVTLSPFKQTSLFCLFKFPAFFRDFAVPERHCFHSYAIT